MLRYIHFDPTTQMIDSFCCSRAVFYDVRIEMPYISFLFDTEYITETFKKYERQPESMTHILRMCCGKCNGFGYYDWIVRLTNGDEEAILNMGGSDPVKVQNENPISVIYQYHNYYYYPSKFRPSPLTYRCEKCAGTGLDIEDLDNLEPITLDDIPPEPPPKIIKQVRKKSHNILRRIFSW